MMDKLKFVLVLVLATIATAANAQTVRSYDEQGLRDLPSLDGYKYAEPPSTTPQINKPTHRTYDTILRPSVVPLAFALGHTALGVAGTIAPSKGPRVEGDGPVPRASDLVNEIMRGAIRVVLTNDGKCAIYRFKPLEGITSLSDPRAWELLPQAEAYRRISTQIDYFKQTGHPVDHGQPYHELASKLRSAPMIATAPTPQTQPTVVPQHSPRPPMSVEVARPQPPVALAPTPNPVLPKSDLFGPSRVTPHVTVPSAPIGAPARPEPSRHAPPTWGSNTAISRAVPSVETQHAIPRLWVPTPTQPHSRPNSTFRVEPAPGWPRDLANRYNVPAPERHYQDIIRPNWQDQIMRQPTWTPPQWSPPPPPPSHWR